MIYIISGTSRSGKTIAVKKLMEKTGIPYLSLDWIMMGFTHGIPEYGIHDKLWPNEIAEKLWSFLSAMLGNMIWGEVDYIIEGEAILPKLISEFMKNHPDKVKVCFVGYTEVDLEEKIKDIKEFRTGKNDWLANESDANIESHIRNMLDYSKRIKEQCKEYELPYFDTSEQFSETLDKIILYMIEENNGK